jgi:universal stress protein E
MRRAPQTKLCRRILVAVRDPAKVPRAQLRKAARLARLTGARIELFHAIGTVRVPGPDPGAVRVHRALERLKRAPYFSGLKITSHMHWDYPPHEAVIRRALETRADFVVAASASHGMGSRLFIENTDWELIRHCPVPLLFIKSSRDYVRPTVLVALDPFHTRAKPAALDARLLASAGKLARLLRGPMHAFHAYLPLVVNMLVPIDQGPIWMPREAERAHALATERAFNRLAQSAGIPAARRHLTIGDVPERLVATVRRIGAQIVVMGAVSRSGLKRLFIGSTAETVLDALRCDVLILKPRGFKTRVPRRQSPFANPIFY